MAEVRFRVKCSSEQSKRIVMVDMGKWFDARTDDLGQVEFRAVLNCIDGDEEGVKRQMERQYGESISEILIDGSGGG